jgi:acyl dehydratase
MTTPGGDLGVTAADLGRPIETQEFCWTHTEALVYALGIGAGQEDPAQDLPFTIETGRRVTQLVLPTFASILARRNLPRLRGVRLADVLHAEETVELHRQIPVAATAASTVAIIGVERKENAVLVTRRVSIREISTCPEDGPLATVTSGLFIRGVGYTGVHKRVGTLGFPAVRRPDFVVTYRTGRAQALLYRLSGDRNPLHYDPDAGRAAGFPAPILHGLCTFGYAGRAVIATICDGDPRQFGKLAGRFSAPVMPGDELTVSIWRTENGASFQVSTPAGIALDHGRFWAPARPERTPGLGRNHDTLSRDGGHVDVPAGRRLERSG